MDVSEIKKAAKEGERPEGTMGIHEELLWYKLKDLYQFRKFKILSDEKFVQEFRKAIAEYRANTTRIFFDKTIRENNAKKYKDMESIASDFQREPTIEKAQQLVRTFYGLEAGA